MPLSKARNRLNVKKGSRSAGGKLERARALLKLEAIRPARIKERIGENAYAALDDDDRGGWFVALPPIPDAPPEEWNDA